MAKRLHVCVLIWLIAMFVNVTAQQPELSASEALLLFENEKYEQAVEMYRQLLERNDRNHALNYYYGVSLYHTSQKADEAIRRLQYAGTQAPSPEVHFYLGKLLQRSYEMEKAIEHYQRFINLYKGEDEDKVTIATRSIDDCNSAIELINKYFEVKIIQKDTVPESDLIKYYSLSADAGQLMKAGDFFRLGVDPQQIIFRTERGDEVYFPIKGRDGRYDLHKTVRLIDSWTEPEAISSPVKSDYNELHPMLLIDGTTLYFSSDRPGGMGGYDIYQTFFDPETGAFSEPANLGPPFNSPDDDFLLVPDLYTGKAWFATNRGVPDGLVVVSEIVWDNSVIRHFTENIHQIKTLAELPLSELSDVYSGTGSYRGFGHDPDQPERVVEGFQFYVNDTLLYRQYDDFVSEEAMELFREGQQIDLEKDSLNNRMSQLRRRYTQSYSHRELNELVDEILKLERKVYGMDDEINRYYRNSRLREMEKIRQLKQQGEYHPTTEVQQVSSVSSVNKELLDDLNNSDFTFYSDEAFLKQQERLDKMYRTLFAPQERLELLRSDSLYVWANILSLESARLLEQTHNMPVQQGSLRDRLFNNNDFEEDIDQQVRNLRDRSRELKSRALELYEQALDQKFTIYYPKAQEIGATSNRAGSENMLSQVITNFSEAEEGLQAISSFNPERVERLLALKRTGVDMMEESFVMQLAGAQMVERSSDGSSTRFMGLGETSHSPESVTHSDWDVTDRDETDSSMSRPAMKIPADLVSSAFGNAKADAGEMDKAVGLNLDEDIDVSVPEYKVQIGVFRNDPDAAALGMIPDVTSEYIPESGLTKYFSGSWTKYSEAAAKVKSIQDAGFNGAFIVAFLNGQPISLKKARELE